MDPLHPSHEAFDLARSAICSIDGEVKLTTAIPATFGQANLDGPVTCATHGAPLEHVAEEQHKALLSAARDAHRRDRTLWLVELKPERWSALLGMANVRTHPCHFAAAETFQAAARNVFAFFDACPSITPPEQHQPHATYDLQWGVPQDPHDDWLLRAWMGTTPSSTQVGRPGPLIAQLP